MPTFDEALQSALRHHQAGQLDQAADLYRALLQAVPQHAGILYYHSVLLQQRGEWTEARAAIQAAIRQKPELGIFHLQLGNVEQRSGNQAAAIDAYQSAILCDPQLADAHAALANIYYLAKRYSESIASYRELLRLEPSAAEMWVNLATVYQAEHDWPAAIEALQMSIRLQPQLAAAHNNLGNVWQELGKEEEAIQAFQQALQLNPQLPETHYNLGNAWLRRGDYVSAVAEYEQTLALKSDHVGALNNLGLAWQHRGDVTQARAKYEEALRLHPHHLKTMLNLAHLHFRQRNPHAAEALLLEIVRAHPTYVMTYRHLADHWTTEGDLPRAIEAYKEGLHYDPDNLAFLVGISHAMHHSCRWQEVPQLEERLSVELAELKAEHKDVISPFVAFNSHVATSAAQQGRFASLWSQKIMQERTGSLLFKHLPRPLRDRIRVGYLSADFHNHATAYLISEMIESHNRERFSIYAYSTGPDYNDEMRVRLKNTFEYFRDLHGQTEEAIAQIIYGDEIDILVDLKGYTAENSAIALSYRPAPVQVNYLGFPGTMGAEFMDYILVDDYLVPPEQASFYTEKLVYLPGCYQVNDSTRKAASPIPTRTELGLPEQGFVFCCFNNNYKISPRMYDVWMRLLQRVPDSVLWLMIGNKHAIPNLQREAEARGVAKDRIFFADTVKLEQHLARISRADLFLDTFPVNAHTTASDALWAGCPLVTLSGETFISRVAGSLLTTLGLSELIACDYDDYESIACRCATDPAWFADIRQRLKNGRSTSDLFQGAAFAKKIEAAFEQMWQIYNAGESPRSIRVPPLSA